jgi:hypothetical protein
VVLVSSPLLTPSRGSCHEKEETHVAFARALGFGLTTHYPLVMTDGFLKHPAFTSLIFPTNHYFASVLFEDFLAMLDNTFWISHSAYPIYFAFFLDFCVHHKKKTKKENNLRLRGSRDSHSVLGSIFLNPSVAAGVSYGSGGTQIRKAPF